MKTETVRKTGKKGLGMPVAGLALGLVFLAAPQIHAINMDEELRREAIEEVSQSLEVESAVLNQVYENREAEFQLGKDVKDVHGNRVRIEQYIFRGPKHNFTPRQYKHLVINTRPDLDNKVDQLSILKTLNKDLPKDLSDVFKSFEWGLGAPPEYYVVTEESKASNSLGDTLEVKNEDGRLVKTVLFSWLDLYETYFETSKLSINGKPKILEERLDISPTSRGKMQVSLPGAAPGSFDIAWTDKDGDGQLDPSIDPIVNEVYWDYMPKSIEESVSFDKFHTHGKVVFQDDTWLEHDEYIINDEGEMLSAMAILDRLLERPGSSDFLYEGVVGASEFKGKIDIVGQPAFMWAGGDGKGNQGELE